MQTLTQDDNCGQSSQNRDRLNRSERSAVCVGSHRIDYFKQLVR
jgi:hypothetical protein